MHGLCDVCHVKWLVSSSGWGQGSISSPLKGGRELEGITSLVCSQGGCACYTRLCNKMYIAIVCTVVNWRIFVGNYCFEIYIFFVKLFDFLTLLTLWPLSRISSH